MAAGEKTRSQIASFQRDLFETGMLVRTDAAGVYGRSGQFERICDAVAALVTRAAAVDSPERLTFPPALPRRQLESIDYLQSFVELARGADWRASKIGV